MGRVVRLEVGGGLTFKRENGEMGEELKISGDKAKQLHA